jgi:hypothetical protein
MILKSNLRSISITSILLVLSVIFIAFSIGKINSLNSRVQILSTNNSTLLGQVVESRDKSDNLVSTVQALIVDKNELKSINGELSKRLKDLSVKYSDVSSVAEVLVRENVTLKAILKDSIRVKVINDTIVVDTLKCFSKVDKYNSIFGCIDGDSIDINMQSNVPLTIVMENVYKHKFLWMKWGVINKRLKVTTDNPNVSFPEVRLYIPK